jgi:hypothetical protein
VPRRLAITTALLAVVVVACGGSDKKAPAGPPSADGTTAAAKTLATLKVYDQTIDIAVGATAAPAKADTGKALAVGDEVRTDAHGFGEIAYTEGSLVRLDSNTRYVVTELARDADTHVTRARMDAGRSWHRVEKLSNSKSVYEVETPTAVAAVRGTTFLVDCRTPVCVFTVVEGSVEVRIKAGGTVLVAAGKTLSVPATAGKTPPQPAAADLSADTFALRNHNIDRGGSSAAVPAPAVGASKPDGTYGITRRTTSKSAGYGVTPVQNAVWVITSTCTGASCTVDVTSNSGKHLTGTLRAGVMTLNYVYDGPSDCGGTGSAQTHLASTWTLRVTERAATDVFTPGPPTRIEGTDVETYSDSAQGAGCSRSKTGRSTGSSVLTRNTDAVSLG